jgi:hypothetical protein
MPIEFKRNKENGRAYYYLYGPVSFPETGRVYERPLAFDDAENDAKSENIYWLDGNGAEFKLPIVVEGESKIYSENPWKK